MYTVRMDSLGDVLGRYTPQRPDEITAIKRFVEQEFNTGVSVAIRNNTIVVTVASASLANALRLRINALRKAAKTDKRVMFRIG